MDMQYRPLLDWFSRQGWTPFPFQEEVWQAYLNGESGLIHAPTGTGKTYAAWLGPLMEWIDETSEPFTPVKRRNLAPGLRVLWITPLRALAADTAQSLQAPLNALGIPWTVETRTGDTPSTVRSRQRAQLPTALITTPESLSLLLTRDNAPDLFRDLRAVIVDEWHELIATKRGVLTELGLARLRRWQPDLRLWGLSATMGNLEAALRTLLGSASYHTGEIPRGRLVQGNISKKLVINSIIPDKIERFPWAGHLGLNLLPQVLEIVEANSSSLIFTNTRSQTERWYQAILDARPDWAGDIALHHSSLESNTRDWVENQLRAGRLRCVVATSSLDLGVDFPAVDAVFQIASPKGAARLMQRAGRSGHRPGAQSKVTCVPAHALELLEVSAARTAIETGQIEDRIPLRNSLDVLVQHVVTVGIGGGFEPDDLYREVRTSHAYHFLSEQEWAWVMDFVTSGGNALKSYPQYSRIQKENGRYAVTNREIERMHRLSIGTILGDANIQVQYLRGPVIGSIQESLASRLKPGDRFTLSGKVLEFVRLRDLKVWVRKAKDRGRKGIVPRWFGGGLPLSEELTGVMRQKLEQAHQGIYGDAEMRALQPLLELQAQRSAIPGTDETLIESVKTREGYHLFFYPFEGRMVHEGLSALIAYRLSRLQPITFTLASNDYGFELLSTQPAPLDQGLSGGLLSTDNLLEDILYSMNLSEMAKRQFREIARIAGLVLPRYPGGQKTLKQIQASSSLIYDVLANYDANNLLLRQAQQEVLQRQLEHTRMYHALSRISAGRVLLKEVRRPTPLAFPLLVDRLRQTVSSETLEDRIRKMQESYERW